MRKDSELRSNALADDISFRGKSEKYRAPLLQAHEIACGDWRGPCNYSQRNPGILVIRSGCSRNSCRGVQRTADASSSGASIRGSDVLSQLGSASLHEPAQATAQLARASPRRACLHRSSQRQVVRALVQLVCSTNEVHARPLLQRSGLTITRIACDGRDTQMTRFAVWIPPPFCTG
jgi:hypothetical protein